MPKPSKGKRLALGEPWASDLADFCAAHYGVAEIAIIRFALDAFIKDRLAAEPEVRRRFEEARKLRLNISGDNVRAISPRRDPS